MIYKGEIIQCPGCELKLFKVTQDIQEGERLSAAHFEGVDPVPSPKNGDRMSCVECGESWFDGRVHLKNHGWCS